ncbi:MAG: sensor histidine kinase, partial [Gemmatimonadota bacterium]
DALSRSLTQARRWAFLEERFIDALPWLVLAVALVLVALAYAATRQLARQLAQPIGELLVLAERLGRGETLPPPTGRSIHEVRVLDGALRAAAAELEESRDRAVAAERLRVWGEMARRVAHEMKNPLTPLRFAVHRLERAGPPGPRDAGYAEAVEVIGQEVARLEDLAAQFSSLGRPPEGPPTEVDLAELVESLLATDAPDASCRVERSGSLPPVIGHYDALLRAFRNLVRNAVEAMEDRPEPRLDVALEATPDGRWLDVRIRDHGPGLPPEGPDRIFEPDFTTRTRGTGLGLALARQSIEADGGTIRARSLETGAEFVVRLPAAQPSCAEERA